MGSREIVAIDADEVLFPMAPTLISWHNAEYRTALSVEQMKSYYLEDLTGDSAEQMMAKIKAYIGTRHYRSAEPIAGSVEGVRRVRERYDTVLLTSRSHFYRGSTEAFIDRYFTGLFEGVYYTHTLEDPNVTEPKYKICQEIGAVTLIDDNLINVSDCAEHDVQGILFGNYAWNTGFALPDTVVRCADWAAVGDHLVDG